MEGSGHPRSNVAAARGSTGWLGTRLDSWKEIASYLGRSEKTVRRWEENEELPVHRLHHEKRGSVYAYTREIDSWREARKTVIEPDTTPDENPLPQPVIPIDAPVPAPRQPGKDSGKANRLRSLFSTRPLRLALSIGLLIVTGAGLLIWHRTRLQTGAATGERIHSLAVLPLENLSEDSGQEYFADGMTAELITELAKIGSLQVISRTSAMRYKRTPKPLGQIARELNVDAVVEGEVLQSRQCVRITVQLVETATDRHLWAETYERDLRDAVDLQSEVAASIATGIRTKVTPEEHARLAGNHRVTPEAYEAYLKGRFFWNKRTGAGLKRAIEYFQSAIAKDPGYALAYAALADSYEISGPHDFPAMKDTYLKAKAAAAKALELDSSLGEAHTVLADLSYGLDRDWRGAEREFKRALELSPGYATAHQRYSTFLSKMVRSEESLAQIRRAQALDPLSPAINGGVGSRLLWARRYDEAIDQLQKSLEMDPGLGLAHMYLGWAYEAKGNPEKAIDEFRKATSSDGGTLELASLGHAYALAGHIPQAKSILKDLQKRSTSTYVPPYEIAIVYAGLGDRNHAFEWLAKSCKSEDMEFVSLKVDPELDGLRSDPRFQDLLRCAGLA